MKRWLWRWMVCGMILLLVGCGARGHSPSVQPVTADFSCRAAIRYQKMELEAQLTRQMDGKLLLTFSRPNSLSGITLGFDGKDMTMELGGMSLALPVEKVPEGALVRRLLQVLAAPHREGAVTEEGYALSGETDGVAYVLVCDPDTGLPLSLTVPEEELTATFTEGKSLTIAP